MKRLFNSTPFLLMAYVTLSIATALGVVVVATSLTVYAGAVIRDGVRGGEGTLIIDGILQEASGNEGESEGEWTGCPAGYALYCNFPLAGRGGSGTGSACVQFGQGGGPPTGVVFHAEHNVPNVTGAYLMVQKEGTSIISFGSGQSPITRYMSPAEIMLLNGAMTVVITSLEYPLGAVLAANVCQEEPEGSSEGSSEGATEGEVTGACCNQGGGCFEYTETVCEALGNFWLGPGTDCTPNPCGSVEGSVEGEGEGCDARCEGEMVLCTIDIVGEGENGYTGTGTASLAANEQFEFSCCKINITHNVPNPTAAYFWSKFLGVAIFMPPESPICYELSAQEAEYLDGPVFLITNAQYPLVAATGTIDCGFD